MAASRSGPRGRRRRPRRSRPRRPRPPPKGRRPTAGQEGAVEKPLRSRRRRRKTRPSWPCWNRSRPRRRTASGRPRILGAAAAAGAGPGVPAEDSGRRSWTTEQLAALVEEFGASAFTELAGIAESAARGRDSWPKRRWARRPAGCRIPKRLDALIEQLQEPVGRRPRGQAMDGLKEAHGAAVSALVGRAGRSVAGRRASDGQGGAGRNARRGRSSRWPTSSIGPSRRSWSRPSTPWPP